MPTETTRVAVPAALSSPRAKLVYLSVATTGGATVDELQAMLSMTKLSLFGVLSTLQRKGLVREEGGRYVVSSCCGANGPP